MIHSFGVRIHNPGEGCCRSSRARFAIEMAFPAQRQTQKEFLEYYNTLKDDDEEKGIDLSHENKDEDEDEDEDEGETGLLDDLLDDQTKDKNDKSHKELDAERRAAEERAMEEVARRFESRGAQASLEEEEEDYSEVDQIKAKMRAEAREAQRKDEAANAARVAAEREKEAKRLAEQSRAMSALYDLYAEDDEERVEMKGTPCATDVPKVPLPRPPPPSLATNPAASSTPAASAASSAPTARPNQAKAPPTKRLKVGSSSTGADLLDSIMGGMDRTMSAQRKKKL